MHASSSLSRRGFLRQAALVSTAAALPGALLANGQAAAPVAEKPAGGLIDLHNHWFSPGAVDFLSRRPRAPRFVTAANGERSILRSEGAGAAPGFPLGDQWFDIDLRLRHLDEQGIQHQLISWPTTLGVDPTLTPEESRELWTLYNNELSAVVRRHPARLSGVAALGTIDPEWSARELARAHDELGLIGGVLPVNVFATLEGAKRIAPVLATAQKYRSHLYLHTGYGHANVPGQPPVLAHAEAPGPRATLDTIWSFAAATITLAYTGFLAAYPDVTVQIAQLGGVGGIALVEELARSASRTGAPTPGDFRQIYLDTGASGRGPEAIALATRVFGPERIVFGTDYAPAASVAPVIANIQASPLTVAQRRAIFRDSGRDLLAAKGVRV